MSDYERLMADYEAWMGSFTAEQLALRDAQLAAGLEVDIPYTAEQLAGAEALAEDVRKVAAAVAAELRAEIDDLVVAEASRE